MPKHNPWTPAAVALLKDLWARDKTAKVIMLVLNAAGYGPFTRNAVIGKAGRLELERRPSPLVKPVEAPDVHRPVHVPPNRCQWPTGHPRDADFRFCGAKVVPGQPYCAGHCERAYRSAA